MSVLPDHESMRMTARQYDSMRIIQFVSPDPNPFIYEARESSLVSKGFLTTQLLQKL